MFLLLCCITISSTISDEQIMSSRTTADTPTATCGTLLGNTELEVVGFTTVKMMYGKNDD